MNAHVIELEGRFFCGWNAKGHMQTAWHVAGARVYGEWRDELKADFERLQGKGKKPVLRSLLVV